MEDEIQRLDELIELGDAIVRETKIERVLRLIDEDFGPDEPILLFTEYKAAQALIANALHG
jgi:ERCC4-related helicase